MPRGIWSAVRYGIVGASGALVQIATLWLWVSVFDIRAYYLAGIWLGFLVALAWTFPLQKYWTFRDATARTTRQFVRYTIIALGTLGANTLLLSITKNILERYQVDFFQLWYLVADAAIVCLVAGVSFVLNRALTFTPPEPPETA